MRHARKRVVTTRLLPPLIFLVISLNSSVDMVVFPFVI
jgi:hypothetical protein